MNDDLQETQNDWIGFKLHKPAKSGYYEVTCCNDPENVIKWGTVFYHKKEDEFRSIANLEGPGKQVNLVRFWRKTKTKV